MSRLRSAVVVVAGALAIGSVSLASAAPPAAARKPATVEPSRTTKECGVGACKRRVPSVAVCKPGAPITENDGWLYKPDPATDSWDANCDGQVEKKVYEPWVYLGECKIEGSQCVPARVDGPECGQKWNIWTCRMTASGECKKSELKGAVTQACR